MKEIYHREITTQALGQLVQADALESIISANLGQDALRYQVGHDHFHFDNNSFAAGGRYIEELRQALWAAAQTGQVGEARACFGRLSHTAQDFYAHSNYVEMWREAYPAVPAQEIDPEDAGILADARLHSGRLYYPLEALSFISALKPLVVPLLPHDSHAWMNKDAPGRPYFDEARAAAVMRTLSEYERCLAGLTPGQVALFNGSTVE